MNLDEPYICGYVSKIFLSLFNGKGNVVKGKLSGSLSKIFQYRGG